MSQPPQSTTIHFDRAHLAPLEPAARILCQMNGDNPDQQMAAPHPLGLQVAFTVPLWHSAAQALLGLTQMLSALKQAHAQAAAESVKVPH
jgi:hypothetical protein